MIITKLNLTKSLLLVFIYLFTITTLAQVGIGNTNPDPSAMLDITSDSQGILTPRMSSAQRLAIPNPANGLKVYDLDERTFYYYEANAAAWVSLTSSQKRRENFVLVKSEADFPTPVGGVITLQTNTYYEINGTITLNNTINLNNAYVAGLDVHEDRLIMTTGTMFSGSTGGSIKNVTLLGGFAAGSGTGTAFNITAVSDQRLLLLNAIIANMASVGTISGLGLYFTNIVQYSGNTTGITYSNIGNLLLSKQGWFTDNKGTYETFTGHFDMIQKLSGFSSVGLGAAGMDVSSNPSPSVGEAVLDGTLFTGAGTFVKKYITGTYPGFNFDKNWKVESTGITRETDEVAYGNIYITAPVVTNITTMNVPVKINGTTSEMRMFRASSPVSNRIEYNGSVKRVFNIQASLSGYLPSGSNVNYTFFIAKNGVPLIDTAIKTKFASGVGGVADIRALSFTGTVDMAPDDFIEIFVENNGGTDNIIISTMNLLIF